MITPHSNRFAYILAGAALLTSSAAFAADATWNVDGAGNWSDNANWNPAAAPGDTSGTTNQDTATFNATLLTTTNRAITADANRNIKNITFDVSGYSLSGNFGYQVGNNAGSLLLTEGGTIELKGAMNRTSNSNVSAAAMNSPTMTLQGNYTFSANATNAGTGTGIAQFFIGGAATVGGAAGLGNVTLTLTGQTVANASALGAVVAGTAGGQVNGKINDGGAGTTVSISKEGAGAWLLNNANGYTGGTTIKQGTVTAGNSSALGTGAVALGADASANNAVLLGASSVNVANAVTVTAGSGTRVIGTNATSSTATFSGAITLNSGSNLRLQKQNSQSLAITGGITGAGDVEVYNNANSGVGAATGVVFSGNAINNVGKVTNASPGTGTLTQATGGVIGSNVTEFVQNSSTSQTTLSLANTYGITTITAGTLATTGTGTLGTGDVTVNGGSLLLGSSVSLSDTATLFFIASASATITLDNLSSDVLAGIVDITTSAAIGEGTWSATDLNNFFETSAFAGSGTLTVAAVPEPTTVAMAIIGFGMMIAVHFRRRSQRAR